MGGHSALAPLNTASAVGRCLPVRSLSLQRPHRHPGPLHHLLQPLLWGLLPCFLAALLMVTLSPAAAEAAEVLQVRGATLLQVGDQNRSYPVRLGCVQVDPADGAAATSWLREALPRRTRVNLRPLGTADGTLLARVTVLSSGIDLGTGLQQAGLATPLDATAAPQGCPAAAASPVS